MSSNQDTRSYEIRKLGSNTPAERFTTGPVNGKTPNDAAVADLADFSEYHDGVFILYDEAGAAMASARSGLVRRAA